MIVSYLNNSDSSCLCAHYPKVHALFSSAGCSSTKRENIQLLFVRTNGFCYRCKAMAAIDVADYRQSGRPAIGSRGGGMDPVVVGGWVVKCYRRRAAGVWGELTVTANRLTPHTNNERRARMAAIGSGIWF